MKTARTNKFVLKSGHLLVRACSYPLPKPGIIVPLTVPETPFAAVILKKEYLYQVFDCQLTENKDIPREYRLNHAVSSFAETVRWWLKEHSEYSPEEIGRFYFESVDI